MTSEQGEPPIPEAKNYYAISTVTGSFRNAYERLSLGRAGGNNQVRGRSLLVEACYCATALLLARSADEPAVPEETFQTAFEIDAGGSHGQDRYQRASDRKTPAQKRVGEFSAKVRSTEDRSLASRRETPFWIALPTSALH